MSMKNDEQFGYRFEKGRLSLGFQFTAVTTYEEYKGIAEYYKLMVSAREGREVDSSEVDVSPKPGEIVTRGCTVVVGWYDNTAANPYFNDIRQRDPKALVRLKEYLTERKERINPQTFEFQLVKKVIKGLESLL